MAALAALAATVLSGSRLLPQIWKLARTGDTSGISLSFATCGLVSEAGWLSYSVDRSLWEAVPDAAMLVGVYALMMGVQLKVAAGQTRGLLLAGAWAAALAGAWVLGGGVLLGVVLPVGLAVQLMPAVWSVYRCDSPSGVSLATWILTVAESALWCWYAAASGDRAYFFLGLLGGTAALAIAVRLVTTVGVVTSRTALAAS